MEVELSRESSEKSLNFFLADWNVDMMSGAWATVLNHEVETIIQII